MGQKKTEKQGSEEKRGKIGRKTILLQKIRVTATPIHPPSSYARGVKIQVDFEIVRETKHHDGMRWKKPLVDAKRDMRTKGWGGQKSVMQGVPKNKTHKGGLFTKAEVLTTSVVAKKKRKRRGDQAQGQTRNKSGNKLQLE